MNRCTFISTYRFCCTLLIVGLFGSALAVINQLHAAPNLSMNYQGKLTDNLGATVADGTYNVRFRLYASPATTTTLWSETASTTVTNGLFSYMLGSTSPLTGVNFNQPLYLGVEIGGTGAPSWDGEMTPRKILGTVPAAFEARRLNGLASSSFLRSDQADTAANLLTFTSGLVSQSSSTITDLTTLSATTTNFIINGERFTDLTGTGLTSSGTALTVATTTLGLGDGTLGGLSDVTTTGALSGNLLSYTGSGWATTSTSTLGLGDGTFTGLSDTQGSLSANRLIFTNSGGTALTDSADLTFDGSNLSIGNSNGIAWGGTRFLYASTSNNSVFFGENAGTTLLASGTSNVGIGYRTLQAATSTTNNTAIGTQALRDLTTGANNTALGRNAGLRLTTGIENVFLGGGAGALNTIGQFNVMIGSSAGGNNTGSSNVFIGRLAGGDNTGTRNIGIGENAVRYLSGIDNVALGDDAGVGSSTAVAVNRGVYLGAGAGRYLEDGADNNILLGYQAADSLTTGANNIIIGYDVEAPSNTGDNQLNIGNILFGTGIDGTGTTLSSGNIGIGTSSPSSKLTVAGAGYFGGALRATGTITFDALASPSSDGLLITNASGVVSTTSTSTLGLGDGTFTGLSDTQGSLSANRLIFTNSGGTALTDNTTLTFDGTTFSAPTTTLSGLLTLSGSAANIALGSNWLSGDGGDEGIFVDGSGNVGVGTSSPNAKLTVAGGINIDNSETNAVISYLGTPIVSASTTGQSISVGYGADSDSTFSTTFGHSAGNDGTTNNQVFGYNAGAINTGNFNILIGDQAGYLNSGNSNILIGGLAGYFNEGTNNTAVGDRVGRDNTGDYNTFFGKDAGYENTGNYNNFSGYDAGRYLQSTSSIAIGAEALYGSHTSNYVSLNNVALGYRAGYASDDGSGNNILLGYQAADSLTTGANNIIIGYDVEAPSNTGDNQLNIGNILFGTGIDGTGTTLSSGNIGIGTTTPSSKLDVWGDFRVGTSSVPAFQVDTTSGRVAIGTSTANTNADFTVRGSQEILLDQLTGVGAIDDTAGPGVALSFSTDLVVRGDYAYVISSSEDALQIIDISDPTNPIAVSSTTDGQRGVTELDGARNITIQGNYAYIVSTVDDALQIIDISNPISPTGSGSIKSGENGAGLFTEPSDIVVRGNYAYIVDRFNDALQIIDISDPTKPTGIGYIADEQKGATELEGAESLILDGNFAYVVSEFDGGMQIVDISDPTNPVGRDAIDVSATLAAEDVVKKGKYVFVTARNFDRIGVFDVTDPDNIVEKTAILDNTNGVDLLDGPYKMALSGDYLLVISGNDSAVQVIDVSDPENAIGAGALVDGQNGANLLGGNGAITVVGNYAYVANESEDGLQIIDLGGLKAPSAEIGSLLATKINTQNLAVSNLLTAHGGLNIGLNTLIGGQLAITGTASTTLATSTPQLLLGGPTARDSFLTFQNGTHDWSVGLDQSDNSFRISSSSVLGTRDYFTIAPGGNIGIGTTSPSSKLTVAGNTYIGGTLTATGTLTLLGTGTSTSAGSFDIAGNLALAGALYDSTDSAGSNGFILQSTGTSTQWVATSSLGIGGGATTFTGLSDTQGSLTANRLIFTNSGGTALTDSADLTFDNSELFADADIDISSTSAYRIEGAAVLQTFDGPFVGRSNIFVGSNPSSIDTSSAFSNTSVGVNALQALIGGTTNTAVGYSALRSNTNGIGNTALGYLALDGIISGNTNVAIGRFALTDIDNSSANTAVGDEAARNVISGNDGVYLGKRSGQSLGTSSDSVIIGSESYGQYTGGVIGNRLTTLGYRAGYNATGTAENNILLGYRAADNLTTGDTNLVLGYDIDLADPTGSNQLNIGNLLFGTGIDGTGTTLSSGNVGIGTTSPSSKLDVWGDFRVGTSSVPLALFDPANNTATFGTSASGTDSRRTLVTMNNATQEFVPSDPQIVGGVSSSTALDGASFVAVAGRYAYVANQIDDSLRIIDVSDPTDPTIVGGVKDVSLLNGAYAVTVAGRYAYVVNTNDASLRIIDVSDPTAPTIIGGVKNGSVLSAPRSIAVAGRYAYVANLTDDSLRIIDVSDPTNPSIVGGVKDVSLLDGVNSVTVAGRYAYVTNETDDSLRIIDVSDPTNPSIVGGVKDASLLNGARSVTVAGRYAYVANLTDDSLRIIDVSDPINPSIVGGVKDASLLNGARSITVAGRYAYVANQDDDSLRIIDLGGIDTPTGNIGSLFATNLDTDRAVVNQLLTVGGGFNVGSDALIGGALTITGSASSSILADTTNQSLVIRSGSIAFGTTSTSTTRLTIQSNGTNDILNLFETSGEEVFTVLESGNIGIGTTSPSSKLTVAGNTYIGGTLTATGTLALLGTGTSTSAGSFDIAGNLALAGALYDGTDSAGSNGFVLQSTGTSTQWVATSTLGFGGGGASTFTGLSDTQGSLTANRLIFTNSGGTALTDDADLVYTTTGLGIGTSSPNAKLTVAGDINIDDPSSGLSLMGTRYFYASSTNDSIAIGENAGATFNSGTTNNVALGRNAGRYASTSNSDSNVFIGTSAGDSSTNQANVFIGFNTGFSNTGAINVAIGRNAARNNTGSRNTFTGADAGYNNTGDKNVFSGLNSGFINTGDNNVFSGFETARYLSATSSVGIGYQALYGSPGSTFAQNNTALGYRAGYTINDDANNNIFIGYGAGDAHDTGSNNIIVGYDIDFQTNTGSNQLNIGNLLFGTGIDGTGTALSSGNIGIGTTSPDSKLTVQGDINISEDFAGLNMRGTRVFAASTTPGAYFIGAGSGSVWTVGNNVLAIGTNALATSTDVSDVLAIGNNALENYTANSGGGSNTAIGHDAFRNLLGNYRSTAVGAGAGENFTGTDSVFIGAQAGANLGTSNGSTIIGTRAAFGNSGTYSGSENVIIGYQAGADMNGNSGGNILLGYQAASNLGRGDSNIVIGKNVDITSPNSNNQLNIGNLLFSNGIDGEGTTLSSGNLGIGTTSPASKLTVVDGSSVNLVTPLSTGAFYRNATGTGAGSESALSSRIEVNPDAAAASRSYYGGFFEVATENSSNAVADLIAVRGQVRRNQAGTSDDLYGGFFTAENLAGGIVGDISAIRALAENESASNVTFGYGVQSTFRNTSSGDITSGVGVYGNVENTGAGTVANAAALYAGIPLNSGGGSITNAYGLYIDNQLVGDTNFALYSVATADSYLAGNLGIGTTSPSSKLDVWGDFRVGTSGTATLLVDTGLERVGIGEFQNMSDSAGRLHIKNGDVTSANYSADSDFVIEDNGNPATLAFMGVGSEQAKIVFGDEAGDGESGAIRYQHGILGSGYLSFDVESQERLRITEDGNVGIGTSSPNSLLDIYGSGYTGTDLGYGFDQYFVTENATADAVQAANRFYINASNTATTTVVGGLYRIADDTTLGNTVRVLEVQADRGGNTQGENTALSGFARTFGVRGTTRGDAGEVAQPAGGFFETEGTTQGNAIRGFSQTITSAALMELQQFDSTFTGTGLLMSFGNDDAGVIGTGDFSSTSSKFIDFQNEGSSVFQVSAYGTTTIGNGTQMASLQIPFGGICVDSDGACSATTTGNITAVSYGTANSDLAEMYFSSDMLEPGEVVYAKGELSVGRATTDTEPAILGVVSTKPGLTLGYDDTSLSAGEKGYPVALTGRVPIKLSTENGPIAVGDPLMLSSIPGIAMKATGTGVIVGTALEAFDGGAMYSATYINQFSDDIVEPTFDPVISITDPRINDGCYKGGGGGAVGEDITPCVPLEATTTTDVIAEANYLAELEAYEAEIARLENTEADTETLADGTTVSVGQVVMFVNLQYRYLGDTEASLLATLQSTTTNSLSDQDTIWSRLVTLAQNFVDGVLTLSGIKADRVETNELCVDGVCVTADDLRAMLEASNNDGQVVDVVSETGSDDQSGDEVGDGAATTDQSDQTTDADTTNSSEGTAAENETASSSDSQNSDTTTIDTVQSTTTATTSSETSDDQNGQGVVSTTPNQASSSAGNQGDEVEAEDSEITNENIAVTDDLSSEEPVSETTDGQSGDAESAAANDTSTAESVEQASSETESTVVADTGTEAIESTVEPVPEPVAESESEPEIMTE